MSRLHWNLQTYRKRLHLMVPPVYASAIRFASTTTPPPPLCTDDRIQATQQWMDDIVIGQKLCPFAPPVRSADRLRLKVSESRDEDALIEEVAEEARLIVGNAAAENLENNIDNNSHAHTQGRQRPETTLLVLNEDVYPAISCFRNLVRASWRIQAESILERGYDDALQIVLFRPAAKHDTYAEHENDDNCSDYTIRSPYPTIHLLRKDDVLKAVQSGYEDLEGLPGRNKAKMIKDGLATCQKRLENCRTSTGAS